MNTFFLITVITPILTIILAFTAGYFDNKAAQTRQNKWKVVSWCFSLLALIGCGITLGGIF